MNKTLKIILLGLILNLTSSLSAEIVWPQITTTTDLEDQTIEEIRTTLTKAFGIDLSDFSRILYYTETATLTCVDGSSITISYGMNMLSAQDSSVTTIYIAPYKDREPSFDMTDASEALWRRKSIGYSINNNTPTKKYLQAILDSTTTQFLDSSQIITNPNSNFILVTIPTGDRRSSGILLDKSKKLTDIQIQNTPATNSQAFMRIKTLSEINQNPTLSSLEQSMHSYIHRNFKSSKTIQNHPETTINNERKPYTEGISQYQIAGSSINVRQWSLNTSEKTITNTLSKDVNKYFIARLKSDALMDVIAMNADFSEIKNNELHLYFEESKGFPKPCKIIFFDNGSIRIDFLDQSLENLLLTDKNTSKSFKEIANKSFNDQITSSRAYAEFLSAVKQAEINLVTDAIKVRVLGYQIFSPTRIGAAIETSIEVVLPFDQDNDAILKISNEATSIDVVGGTTTLHYEDDSFIEVSQGSDGYTIKVYKPELRMATKKIIAAKTYADLKNHIPYAKEASPNLILNLAERALFIAFRDAQIQPKAITNREATLQEKLSAANAINKKNNRNLGLATGGGALVGGAIVGGGFAIKEAINFYKSKTLSPQTISHINKLTAFCVETEGVTGAERTTLKPLLKTQPVIQTSKITNTSYAVFTGSRNGDWKFVVESFEQQGDKLVRTPNPKAENFVLKLKLDKNSGKAETTFSFETYFMPVNETFRTGNTYAKYAITPRFINKKTGKKYALVITTNNESLESVTAAINENV